MGYTEINKTAIIFSAGKPPIGSWHQRIRMMNRGFAYHNINFHHIVPYPAPDISSAKNCDDYIKFCFRPVKTKQKRNVLAILYKLIGTWKGIQKLKQYDSIEFIIMPTLDFIQGMFVIYFCRKRGIPYYAEIVDEHGKRYSEEKLSFIDKLAIINQVLYEKYILKYADRIFVVSSYLEKKYQKLFPEKKIEKTIPSFIDYNYYQSQTANNITEVNQDGIENLLSENFIKIVYAGACNRTNGLFFFLDAASELKRKGVSPFKIFFFFVYGNVKKVAEYCKKIDLNEDVLIFGPVLSKYIPAIYNCADILLLPEHGDIVANAGFPGKVSELLTSGKAILSTNFSDLSSYLVHEKNALVSEIGDMQTYTDNLDRLLKDSILRSKLGVNAIETAKRHFDCKSAVKVYIGDE